MSKTVAILTPTYNRAYILNKLYESLCRQTSFDFTWYVVDDGSRDETESYCNNLTPENFEIVYIKKENGGKHSALNVGIERITEELTFIVDSDDYLTDDAVETIINDWKQYNREDKIGGLCYLKLFENKKVVGDLNCNDNEVVIDTYANVRINQGVKGDKAEVYKTGVLKQHKFPVFPGEKFLSEAVVWNAISRDGYKLCFLNNGIYICEYRSDGLSHSGRSKMLTDPLGYVEHAKSHLYKGIKQSIQWKYTLMYVACSRFAKQTAGVAFKVCPRKLKFICVYPFGVLLSIRWQKKYGK